MKFKTKSILINSTTKSTMGSTLNVYRKHIDKKENKKENIK